MVDFSPKPFDFAGLGVDEVNPETFGNFLIGPEVHRNLELIRGLRAPDVQNVISRLSDLSEGLDGQQSRALRGTAEAGMRQRHLNSLRELRGLGDRASPPQLANARRADLIRERLRGQADLERQMIADDLNRRPQVLGQLNAVVGQDIDRRQNLEQAISSTMLERQKQNLLALLQDLLSRRTTLVNDFSSQRSLHGQITAAELAAEASKAAARIGADAQVRAAQIAASAAGRF